MELVSPTLTALLSLVSADLHRQTTVAARQSRPPPRWGPDRADPPASSPAPRPPLGGLPEAPGGRRPAPSGPAHCGRGPAAATIIRQTGTGLSRRRGNRKHRSSPLRPAGTISPAPHPALTRRSGLKLEGLSSPLLLLSVALDSLWVLINDLAI